MVIFTVEHDNIYFFFWDRSEHGRLYVHISGIVDWLFLFQCSVYGVLPSSNFLILFLLALGGISPLIVYHVTTPGMNRFNSP